MRAHLYETRAARVVACCAALAFTVSTGCGSGSSGDSTTAPPTAAGGPVVVDPRNGTFELFTDPAEPRLFRFVDASGAAISVFGAKDDAGQVGGVTSVFGEAPEQRGQGAGTWLHLDEASRPSRIVAADGSTVELTWQGDGSAVIDGISGDGAAQASTSAEVPAALTRDPSGGTTAALSADATPPSREQSGALPTKTLFIAEIKRCGISPADRDVQNVHMTVENAPGAPTYPATRLDSGRYAATLPLNPTTPPPAPSSAEVEKLCGQVGTVVVKSCNDKAYANRMRTNLCGKLATALDAAQIGGPGTPITKACNDGFAHLGTMCLAVDADLAIGTSPADAAKTVSALLCGRLKALLANPFGGSGPILASATVSLKGAGTRKSSAIDIVNAGAGGPAPPPQVTVDFGDAFQVRSVTTDPPDPAPGEGYTVRVQVACSAGKKLIVSVGGSDGYSNVKDFWPDFQGETFELAIPGGAASVRDRIILADSFDHSTLRVVSIVF
jgi:hypothetical protein